MRIGVDVGGTKVEAVLLDSSSVARRARVPVGDVSSADAILASVVGCVRDVWDDAVDAVGVALPGLVLDGVCTFNPNLPGLVGVPVAERLAAALGVPVRIANDANCFALAEFHHGAGRGSRNMVGVILGTGVGGGLIFDGRLYAGSSGAAGEIGQMRVPSADRWEDLLPGPAIERRFREATGRDLSAQEIMSGSEDAASGVRSQTYRLLGLYLASLINAFNPDCLVLGGGVSKSLDLGELRAAVEPFCVPGAFAACRLERFAVADSAGALGAASLE